MPNQKKSNNKKKTVKLPETQTVIDIAIDLVPRFFGRFIVEDGLTMTDIFDRACEDAPQCVVIDVEREDTAAGSISKFRRAFELSKKPGLSFEGWATPVAGGILRMKDVGVVIRNAEGERIYSPPDSPHLPVLYAPTNDNVIYAAFGGDIVATIRLD